MSKNVTPNCKQMERTVIDFGVTLENRPPSATETSYCSKSFMHWNNCWSERMILTASANSRHTPQGLTRISQLLEMPAWDCKIFPPGSTSGNEVQVLVLGKDVTEPIDYRTPELIAHQFHQCRAVYKADQIQNAGKLCHDKHSCNG